MPVSWTVNLQGRAHLLGKSASKLTAVSDARVAPRRFAQRPTPWSRNGTATESARVGLVRSEPGPRVKDPPWRAPCLKQPNNSGRRATFIRAVAAPYTSARRSFRNPRLPPAILADQRDPSRLPSYGSTVHKLAGPAAVSRPAPRTKRRSRPWHSMGLRPPRGERALRNANTSAFRSPLLERRHRASRPPRAPRPHSQTRARLAEHSRQAKIGASPPLTPRPRKRASALSNLGTRG